MTASSNPKSIRRVVIFVTPIALMYLYIVVSSVWPHYYIPEIRSLVVQNQLDQKITLWCWHQTPENALWQVQIAPYSTVELEVPEVWIELEANYVESSKRQLFHSFGLGYRLTEANDTDSIVLELSPELRERLVRRGDVVVVALKNSLIPIWDTSDPTTVEPSFDIGTPIGDI